MAPDEAALRRDLSSAAYRLGEKAGRWRLARLQFPLAYFEISAPPRPSSPDRFLLRLNAEGYRAIGPTGELWHAARGGALLAHERPQGPNGILLPFQIWGVPCTYHPIDRLAQDHWANDFHELRWDAGSDITTYLGTIHDILDHPEYVGAAVSEGALAL